MCPARDGGAQNEFKSYQNFQNTHIFILKIYIKKKFKYLGLGIFANSAKF
jgi:hypothetical protein